MGPLQADYAHL